MPLAPHFTPTTIRKNRLNKGLSKLEIRIPDMLLAYVFPVAEFTCQNPKLVKINLNDKLLLLNFNLRAPKLTWCFE